VTADVPPYTIVGGNPAKPVKARFSEAQNPTLKSMLDRMVSALRDSSAS